VGYTVTGGTHTTSGSNEIYTFTANDTFLVSAAGGAADDFGKYFAF
jgi:hypothetical protein